MQQQHHVFYSVYETFSAPRDKMFTNVNKIISFGVNSVTDTLVLNIKMIFSNSQNENLTTAVTNRR